MTHTQDTAEQALARRFVMSLIQDARAGDVARTVARLDMKFRAHWVWRNGTEYFTREGLLLLAQRLKDEFPADAAAIEGAITSMEAAVKMTPAPRVQGLPGRREYWWDDKD